MQNVTIIESESYPEHAAGAPRSIPSRTKMSENTRHITYELPRPLNIRFPSATPSANPKHKRIYVTANLVAFIINQIVRRFIQLELALVEYDEFERAKASESPQPLHDRGVIIDCGYPKRNDIVSTAWDIVDWTERLRKVFGCLTGVKKSSPWYQATFRALANVEDIRNFAQHLDGSIKKLVDGTYPLMGTLMASFPALDGGYYVRILMAGSARYAGDNSIDVPGFSQALNGSHRVECVVLTVADLSINLTLVVSSVSAAKAELEASLKAEYNFDWPD
jgi:hypothetical protein